MLLEIIERDVREFLLTMTEIGGVSVADVEDAEDEMDDEAWRHAIH